MPQQLHMLQTLWKGKEMIRKLYFIVLLLLLLTACKDCSKPTKTVCEYWYPIVVPMVVGKVTVMNTIMTCGRFKEIPNECYKEVVNE